MATSNNVQEELQVLKDDITKIRTDLGDLIEQLRELGLQKINETRDTLEDELDSQREKLRATFNRARERGRGTAEEFEQHITEHPLASLLTAFSIGYIMAKLGGR
jgi:ElaB/YqjD/DUF883 family membrane-anchored ribosome-binding protein